MSGTTRVSETVWSGAGSGCSTLNTALAAAASFNTGCAKRAMADVSAAADPNTGGLSVYAPDDGEELLLVAVRRHQRVVADHRVGLRAGGRAATATPRRTPTPATCST